MVVCITGGAGSGKSYVCDILKNDFNISVIDSDSVTKSLYEPGSEVYKRIIEYFGEKCIDEDGRIDRQYLSGVVFNNPDALKRLNEITHPATLRLIKKQTSGFKGRNDNIIVVESAIAHKSGYTSFCDEFWYVYAPEADRIHRLKNTRNYSDDKIAAIFMSQDDDAFFRDNCNEIIINSNDCDRSSLVSYIGQLIAKKIK
ncbi:MAG: dephospho-CoA kinase [Clostridiales bacterium]|nr:dephospho-CoA kinase [Clostridiales bacterium]